MRETTGNRQGYKKIANSAVAKTLAGAGILSTILPEMAI
jgi:hypothetical protein